MCERLTYSVEEFAALTGVSRGTAYEAVRLNQVPAIRLGKRRIVIPRAALERLLDQSETGPALDTEPDSEPNSPIGKKGCGCAQP